MIVMALATWRIATMLHDERGPASLFIFMRSLVGIGHDDNGNPFSYPSNVVADALACPACLSVWVGFMVALLQKHAPGVASIVVLPFALSALAILFEKQVYRRGVWLS